MWNRGIAFQSSLKKVERGASISMKFNSLLLRVYGASLPLVISFEDMIERPPIPQARGEATLNRRRLVLQCSLTGTMTDEHLQCRAKDEGRIYQISYFTCSFGNDSRVIDTRLCMALQEVRPNTEAKENTNKDVRLIGEPDDEQIPHNRDRRGSRDPVSSEFDPLKHGPWRSRIAWP